MDGERRRHVRNGDRDAGRRGAAGQRVDGGGADGESDVGGGERRRHVRNGDGGATGDSATEGTDYATVNDLTLTIDAGQPSGTATFTLTLTNDTLGEGDETISVTGTTTVPGLSVSGTELTITDDDSASTEVELTVSLTSVEENARRHVRNGDVGDAGRRGADGCHDRNRVGGRNSGFGNGGHGLHHGERPDADHRHGSDVGGTATFTLTPTNDTLGEGDETISVAGTTTGTGLTP